MERIDSESINLAFLRSFRFEKIKIISDFSERDNLWLNRSTLIFQLKYKDKLTNKICTELMNGMDRQTGDMNDFWYNRDYLPQMKNMNAALFMSHGFNDWNVMPEHSYRIYKKAKEMGLDTKIYYHQNGHGGPPPITMMNRWFTRYLHGVENDVENDENDVMKRRDAVNPGTNKIRLRTC